MSIATQIAALQQDKSDIATAITNKGGTVNLGDGFDDFAADIATIPSGGVGDTITAVNNTGASISSGDKVWICKDAGNAALLLRTFTYADQYSYTGFAKTSGANGASISVETVFPDEITITLSTTTDDAYLDVR